MISNYIKYYLRTAFYSVGILFTGVSMIQVFLTGLGVDAISLGVFTSLVSVIQVLTNIVFSTYGDRCKSVKKYMALLCIPIGACSAVLVPLCLATQMKLTAVFILTASICILQMLFITLYNVLAFKLPYSIIDIQNFGRFASIDGIIAGVASTAASFAVSEFLIEYDVRSVFVIAFGIGGACMLIAAIFNASLDTSRKSFPTVTVKEQKQGMLAGFRELWNTPSFRRLMIPNFLRGIHVGMLSVATVIAVSCGFSAETAGQIVTVTFIGNISGSFLYMIASRYINSRKLCLLGSLIICVGIFMPFCTDTLFLAVYFITMIGKYIIDYAVPSRVYVIIPAEIACRYQTWRMIITTVGIVLSSAVSGIFIEYISVFGFIVIASVCQLICGICYHRVR